MALSHHWLKSASARQLPACTSRCTFESMSQRYSIAEARSRLPAIVDQAESGAEVELTRRGRPVAVVVSRAQLERLRGARSHFGDAYRKFIERYALNDVGVDADFASSTRDRGVGRKVSL